MIISVIVPVYNVEHYLKRCVDSILNQTFTDFELILVDDGSPDNCGKICDEYATKDDRIVVIHKENGGLSDARNKGIDWAFANSDSEWITFIDSDDWVHKQYLELLYKTAIENDVLISCCDYTVTNGETQEPLLNSNVKFFSPEQYWCYTQSNAAIAWGKMYKKHLLNNIRFPKGVINEDEFTTHKLLFQCDRISFIDIKLYNYFVNGNSIMHSRWSLSNLNAFTAYHEQCDFFLKHGFLEAFKCSNRAYVWMIYYMFYEKCVVPRKYRKYKSIILKEWKNNLRRWRKNELIKRLKKYHWPFEIFYPIKVGLIDNIKETLNDGGFKSVI